MSHRRGGHVASGVLAIDAGNSKTDVALIDEDGSVLGVARGDSFLPHVVGAEAAVAGLSELVVKAAADAGLAEPGPTRLVRHTSACLANADLPAEQRLLEAAVAAQRWGESSAVFNDTYALLRAGLDRPEGVAVVCGAGINCTGVLADGREVRFAAVGHISGDWGGGGFLWQEAMWWAARAADGRGPDTALREALPRHFGLTTMQELIEEIHLDRIPHLSRLEMTPLLFGVADSGDAVAVDIVLRQASEVVGLAVAALRRLEVLGQPMDVVLGGGVLAAGHRLLMDAIDRLLAEAAPYARTRVVTAAPVVGAGLLGLDHIGADEEAKRRLRATGYRPPD